jgi:hypothetical protein
VLQVGIDDGGAGRARCQDALDAGAGQAAPPIRLMQRTRESSRASARTTSQVPSGELSSTKMTSKAVPVSAVSSRRNSVVTLSRSLKGRDNDRKLR